MLIAMFKVIATNLNPELATSPFLFTSNLLHMASEIAIVFSLISLSRAYLTVKHYLIAVVCAALYCLVIEYCRHYVSPYSPFALFPVFTFFAAIAAFWSIQRETDPDLSANLFLKSIAYLELGLAVLALIRFVSFFLLEPISPRQPSNVAILLFSVQGVISVYRYISYQSLRISWVDSKNDIKGNLLNKNLVSVINDKNELTQKLISSNRALGVSALANTLTHQLSQPITGIAIQTDVVLRDLPKTQENKKSLNGLQKISSEVMKLSDLVNNLRNLFNRGDCDFKKQDIASTCETVVNLYNQAANSKQIKLDVSYETTPLANINEIQIQQVLINVLNNAFESVRLNTSQHKEVSLKLTNTDSDAVILITDSGQGIAQEMKEQLFELYKTSKPKGMGIGLWLSKTIIDRHNGSISINSSTGVGTTVEIRLPLTH